MGLFKKEKKDSGKNDSKKMNVPESTMPKLPELPKLPDFQGYEEDSDYNENELPQLPSFPNNTLGNKFSQNTIKDAVAGEKEVEPEEAEDFEENEEPMMQKPLAKTMPASEMPEQRNYPSYSRTYTTQKKPEPVFIRLDKFEESMDIFNNAKEQISEIEKFLNEIKNLKQKEDEELNSWEDQIQEIKKQIEKVDQDIFSKI